MYILLRSTEPLPIAFTDFDGIHTHVHENTRNGGIGGGVRRKAGGIGCTMDKQLGDTQTKANLNKLPVSHSGCRPWARANGNWKGTESFGETGVYFFGRPAFDR